MNFLKLTLIALVLNLFGTSISFSSEEKIDKTVAKQPAKLIFDHRLGLHVFCLGQDINYDGTIDTEAGDEHPSWWTADGINDPEKKTDLRFSPKSFLGFPFEPGVDLGYSKDGYDAKLYFYQDKWLHTYSIHDQRWVDSLELPDPISAVYYHDRKLYLSRAVEDGGFPYVFVKDITEKNYEYIDTLEVAVRPKRVLAFENSIQKYLAVIDEGNFGAGDSKLFIFNDDKDHEYVKEIPLGNGANHITQSEELLIITVNGSSNVVLIDKETLEITKTIPIPTSNPYNGPREAIVGNFKTFVSSYDGKLFVLDLESGEVESDIEYDGKTEGMAYDPYLDILYVASISQKDSYDPDTKYTIIRGLLSAENDNNIDLEIYPNPTSDFINIILNDDKVYNLSIMDLNGRTVVDLGQVESDFQLNLNDWNLSSGEYYVVIKSNKYLKAIPIIYTP